MAGKYLIFRFADAEAHEREFSLVKAGETLAVEPKAFRVLLILLRNPKKLIPKEELLNAVWGDAAVTENSLARAIALLRRLLSDDAREPRFIETVTSVGYRWLCPVEREEDPNAAAATQEPDTVGLANGTSPPAAAEPSSVAIGQSRGVGAIEAVFRADEAGVRPARRLAQWIPIAAAALVAALLTGFAVAYFRPVAPDRIRFKAQIEVPEAAGTMFRISPDGKLLSVGQCEAFACKFSVRPLEKLEFQPIGDGIPGAWSPDSKFLVSMSAGKLYKNPASGGPPTYLADAPPGYNYVAAWLDTGSIVIAADTGLYRLPDSGGKLTRLSSELASGASWLPGDRFLYSNNHGVFASFLRGGKPVQVLADSVDATYVPPGGAGLRGHLVFTRAGALISQEFDLGKLRVVGDPVHIVPSGSDPGSVYVNSVVASRNGVLAFRTGDYGRLALAWFDRSGRKLQTVSEPFEVANNATNRLSPDDSRVIVAVEGPDARNDLWIADLERGTFTRSTFGGAVSGGLWSPDGKNMLWADLDSHLYMKAADGSGTSELLFRNPNCPSCLIYDWSQDGKLCSFATYEAGAVKIWLADLDGDRKPYPFRVSSFNDFYGMFSPDRRWLAYASDESGQTEIYIESIPSGTRRLQVSAGGGNWPVWRHDGAELFYRQGKDVMVVSVRITATDIEIGKPLKLFSAPIVTRFMVSRDGQRFLIALPVESLPPSTPITVDTDWRAGWARPK